MVQVPGKRGHAGQFFCTYFPKISPIFVLSFGQVGNFVSSEDGRESFQHFKPGGHAVGLVRKRDRMGMDMGK